MIEVALGAGLGASVRYLMTQVLKSRTRVFPWATFIINITGALLLAFLHSKITSSHILLLLGTGFLGGYTTFSTYQVENDAYIFIINSDMWNTGCILWILVRKVIRQTKSMIE